ncbi:MAG: NTP transferase domain-containing protein [Planctomycetota bacterium]
MGVVAGVQARMGSTRLPGKTLADLAGAPLIVRVVERARAARRVDEVVVLTSVDPRDDELAAVLAERGIPCRRGPVDDVLARYLALADELAPDYVVRITGDCPLIEPAFLDLQLAALAAFDGDFTWVARGGVEGTLGGQRAMSARALLAARDTSDPRDREHVASFFFQTHRDRFRWVEIDVPPGWRRDGVRLHVDEPADLALLRAIYTRFAPDHGSLVPLAEALAWLDAHPEVAGLNRAVAESDANRALRLLARAPEVPLVGRWPR